MDSICTVCGASWACEHQEASPATGLSPIPPAPPLAPGAKDRAIEAAERLHQLQNDPLSLTVQAAALFVDAPWIGVEEPF
jgi:hypothetical protein